MTIKGKEYEVVVDGKVSRRRTLYKVASTAPTPEQKKAIDHMERGVHGDWGASADPYHVMRNCEYLGVEFEELELHSDGKWYPLLNPDVSISLMQEGAL